METEAEVAAKQTAEGRRGIQLGAVLAVAGAALLIVGLPLPWATAHVFGESNTWSGIEAGAGPRYLVLAGLTVLFALLVQLRQRGRIPMIVAALLATFAATSEIVTVQDLQDMGDVAGPASAFVSVSTSSAWAR